MTIDHDAIRARADAATRGPWDCDGFADGDVVSLSIYEGCNQGPVIADRITSHADAAFLLHARTDVPALLDENAQLRAALDAVRDRLLWLDSTEEMDPSSLSHRNVSAKGVASVIRRDIAAALGPKSEAAE